MQDSGLLCTVKARFTQSGLVSAIRSPSRRHAQGSMQLCIRRNPNMAAHSIFSESLYGHAVLIRSCFSGFIISLFHKRRKGIAIFNIDSHVWISPYTLTSTELHAPSPAKWFVVYSIKQDPLTQSGLVSAIEQ